MTTPDHIAGFVMKGKKWNPEKKQYEPAAFLNVYLYEIDSKYEPVKTGTKKLSNKLEVPTYKIQKLVRIPLSTLSRVVADEAKKCQVYYSEPRMRQ